MPRAHLAGHSTYCDETGGDYYAFLDVELAAGDRLLLLSDGAFEVHNAEGDILGIDGLIRIVQQLGYPETSLNVKALEEVLNRITPTTMGANPGRSNHGGGRQSIRATLVPQTAIVSPPRPKFD